MWGDVLNIGQATQWASTDGLGVNWKAYPETDGFVIVIFEQTDEGITLPG